MFSRIALSIALTAACSSALGATYTVSNTAELRSRMLNVNNGDTIILNNGVYAPANKNDKVENIFSLSESNGGRNLEMSSRFVIRNVRNVTIKAKNKGQATLKGVASMSSFNSFSDTSDDDGKYIIYAQKADGLTIQDINFRYARIAIVADRSDNVNIIGNNIQFTEHEAVHLRDGSDGARIKGNVIKNIGAERLERGEAIYICNDKKKWHSDFTEADDDIYQFHCDNTIIENNTVGPNVGAELIDIKEGVSGTVIRNNNFIAATTTGSGSDGQFGQILKDKHAYDPGRNAYRKSLIHDKGVNSLIHGNTFNMANAIWFDNTGPYGAIRAEEIIKDRFCGYDAFGRNGIYVDNKLINSSKGEVIVTVPGDGGANIKVGCDTTNGTYKYHRTKSFSSAPFAIGGTGSNVQSNTGSAVKTNCQSLIDGFSFKEPGVVYKNSTNNYRCASASTNSQGTNYSHPSLGGASTGTPSGSTSGSSTSSGSTSSSGGGDVVSANWNNNSAASGQVNRRASVSYSNGKLHGTITGTDPYVVWNETTNVNNYDKVKIRIRNASTNGKTDFRVFANNGSWGSKGFTVPADNAWKTITVNMSGVGSWSGSLNKLRIDAPQNGSGKFSIDYVTLVENTTSSPTTSTSSTSSSSSSGGTSGDCLSYSYNSGLKELSFASGSGGCVNISGGNLSGSETAIADSDTNDSCDLRGTATGSGGGSWTIDGNWELPSGLSGTRLNINVTNNCKHFKLRIRP